MSIDSKQQVRATLSEWQSGTIGDYASIKHGWAFESRHFTSEGKHVVLTPGNFFEEGGFRPRNSLDRFYNGKFPREYILKKGDLIVAMTQQAEGLLGSPAIIPESDKYLHNQRLGLVTITKPHLLDVSFLFFLLNLTSVRNRIEATAGGTKVKHTSPSKILSVPISIPSLGVQRTIVRVLSAWDGAVEQTERLIAAKRRRKLALMQQLLTGRRRFRNFIKRKLSSNTKFGPVPADWRYLKVGEFASEVSARNTVRQDLPVLSCTKYDGLVESLKYFGKRVFSEDTANYKVVRRNQFAYPCNHVEEGSIGVLAFVDAGIVSPIYTVFQTDDRVHVPYLYALFKTELYRHIFQVSTSASVDRRGSLRWAQFARIPVALPNLQEQKKIATVLACCDREIEALDAQLDALKEQKKGLVQQLLTGKVRIVSRS